MSVVRILTYAVMSNHFHVLLAVDHPENKRATVGAENPERRTVVANEAILAGMHDILVRLERAGPELGYPE